MCRETTGFVMRKVMMTSNVVIINVVGRIGRIVESLNDFHENLKVKP